MKMHYKKIQPFYYEAVENGTKTYELRKNDCHYQVGDLIMLEEYEREKYTDRKMLVAIINMLQGYTGLQEGYCILGIQRVL